MSVTVIVSLVLLGGMVVTAAAEIDNARAASEATAIDASAPLIIAANESNEDPDLKQQLSD